MEKFVTLQVTEKNLQNLRRALATYQLSPNRPVGSVDKEDVASLYSMVLDGLREIHGER